MMSILKDTHPLKKLELFLQCRAGPKIARSLCSITLMTSGIRFTLLKETSYQRCLFFPKIMDEVKQNLLANIEYISLVQCTWK